MRIFYFFLKNQNNLWCFYSLYIKTVLDYSKVFFEKYPFYLCFVEMQPGGSVLKYRHIWVLKPCQAKNYIQPPLFDLSLFSYPLYNNILKILR